MGLLVEGKWQDRWYDTDKHGGRFLRETAGFRNWVTRDGAPGPSGEGGFKAESARVYETVNPKGENGRGLLGEGGRAKRGGMSAFGTKCAHRRPRACLW